MRTSAARIHGRGDVRIDDVELPPITPDEVLLKVVSSSMCLSTYKAVTLGPEHKRVPDDVADNPVMTGHEFAGIIEEVGANLTDRCAVGQHVAIQPAMGLPGGESPGYSYPFYGGDATYTIVPKVAIDLGCVLPYDGDYFANASLAEPMMCVIGAFHANFHTREFVYEHQMGLKPGGRLALLGAAGPMGLGAIQYALEGPYRPRLVVVTDVDAARLERARALVPPERASEAGVRLVYLNTADAPGQDAAAALRAVAEEPGAASEGAASEGSASEGYDDVFVFAPIRELVETADAVLARDGCLNLFAGPTDRDFTAGLNFYRVHYESTHVVGTSGGSASDMQESLDLSAAGRINPSMLVTHIGGLDAVPETVVHLPQIPGGKKLIYPHIALPLTAIDDFAALGADDPLFARLAEICAGHQGLWNADAEAVLLDALDPAASGR